MTHNEINIGNTVRLMEREGFFTVTDVLDGYRGIGLTPTGDIHSKDRFFVDIEDIGGVER